MLQRFSLFPEQASTVATQVDHFYFFLVAVSGFFATLIATLVIVFAIRYRRRWEGDVTPKIHGSLKLELFWTLVPFALTMVMFFWSANIYLTIRRPPDDALQVFVVAKQWMWKLQHMEGRREINELHVPVGRAVKLLMTSEDVIHSFYVPAFRIKADVVPGRYNTAWFEATKPGSYHLFCAEYCGTEHAGMIGRVVVMDPADYQVWLSGKEPRGGVSGVSLAPQTTGEALFRQYGCASCHRNQPGALGPNLIGLFGSNVRLASGQSVVADEAYLRESIVNPRAKLVEGYKPVMPTFKGQVDEESLLQLIQYIKSLQSGGKQ